MPPVDPALVDRMRAGVARMDRALARGGAAPPSAAFAKIVARVCDRYGLHTEAAIVRGWPLKGSGMSHPDDQLTAEEREFLETLEELCRRGMIEARLEDDDVHFTPTQKGVRALEEHDAERLTDTLLRETAPEAPRA